MQPTKINLLIPFFLLFGTVLSAQTKNLVVLDSQYPSKESLLASIPVSTRILQLNQNDNLWGMISSALSEDNQISDIHLILKNSNSGIGTTAQGFSAIEGNIDLELILALPPTSTDRNLFIYNCSLANNSVGVDLLRAIGTKTDFNVLSASNCESILDEGFNFDFSSKNQLIDTNLLLD